jgi:hypothetical protein
VAAHQLDVVRLEPCHLVAVVKSVDDPIAAAQYRVRIEFATDGLGGARHTRRLSEDLLGTQQRLRRHAGVVRALAADKVALDERDPLAASLGQATRGDLPGGARAYHNYVELAFDVFLQPACRR